MLNSIKLFLKTAGDALSSIIMSKFPLLMVYGLADTIFSKSGYFPIDELKPVLHLLGTLIIPLMLAYSSGNFLHEKRGGYIAVAVVSGLILQEKYINVLGVILISLFSVWLYKKMEKKLEGKFIGFEMLTSNLLAVLYSLALMLGTLCIMRPILDSFMSLVLLATGKLIKSGMIALLSLIIEPAKIFNMNNIINSTFLTPIGLEQTSLSGSSVLFFLEANPGPGLGIMLAYLLLSKGKFKENAGKSSAVHLFGGIHELYFPYVLLNPWLFAPLIISGFAGSFFVSRFSSGLSGPVSPGSVITILLMAKKENLLPVISGILISAIVSGVISAAVLKISNKEFSGYALKMEEMKINKTKSPAEAIQEEKNDNIQKVEKIVFACDAGMGSSAIGESILSKKLKEKNINIDVEHCSVKSLKEENNVLIITQKNLVEKVRKKIPSANCLTLINYLDQEFYDDVVKRFEEFHSAGE